VKKIDGWDRIGIVLTILGYLLVGCACSAHAETLTLYCEGAVTSYFSGQAFKNDWKNTLTIDLEKRAVRYATFPANMPSEPLTISETQIVWDNMTFEPFYRGNIHNIGSINRMTGQYFNRNFNPNGTYDETEANCRPFKSRMF
jgi:hypothetical protein